MRRVELALDQFAILFPIKSGAKGFNVYDCGDGFIAKNYPDNADEMLKKLSEAQPIGRMGQPDEVAAMAVFLCSDEASFITGCPYPVDGGTLNIR